MHDLIGTTMHRRSEQQDRLAARLSVPALADNAAMEQVVRAVFKTMHGDLSSKETSLLAEVEELGRTIEQAKAEISALQVGDITNSHIPSATDELDAIVAHTAAATNSILEVCETLDKVAATLTGAASQQLGDATTQIYEACGFQDITGQRISKVVLALKAIDEKVAHILKTFRVEAAPSAPVEAKAITSDDDLLNGPQLPIAAMDQSEIDRLLASFE
jgi:chemotaxis protein CheZ